MGTTVIVIRDIAGLSGVGAVIFGAWQVYPPAGWIVGGLFLVVGAFLSAANDPPTPSPPPSQAGPLNGGLRI